MFSLPSFILCFDLQIYLILGFLSQCNKMSCPNCNTLSCYICRQVITGYEHFNQVGILSVSLYLFAFISFLCCLLGIVVHVGLYICLFSCLQSFFCRFHAYIILLSWFDGFIIRRPSHSFPYALMNCLSFFTSFLLYRPLT